MTYLDPSEAPKNRVSSALFVGAASPLWGYFGAATAGGLAFWWMTRWTRPVNLEAMFAIPSATKLIALGGPTEVISETVVEAAPDLTPAIAAQVTPEPAIEPVSPAAAEPELATMADPEPEPAIEVAAEPIQNEASVAIDQTALDLAADIDPTAKPEPVAAAIAEVEAAAGEPTAKPRARKAAEPQTPSET